MTSPISPFSKKATADIPSLVVISILCLIVLFVLIPFFQKGSSEQYGTLKEISKDIKATFDKLTGKEAETRKTQADGEFLKKYDSFVKSFQSCFSSSKSGCFCRIPLSSPDDQKYVFELKKDSTLGYYIRPYRIDGETQSVLQKRIPLAPLDAALKKKLCYITSNTFPASLTLPLAQQPYSLESFFVTQSTNGPIEDSKEAIFSLTYTNNEKLLTDSHIIPFLIYFYKPTPDQMCFINPQFSGTYVNRPLCDESLPALQIKPIKPNACKVQAAFPGYTYWGDETGKTLETPKSWLEEPLQEYKDQGEKVTINLKVIDCLVEDLVIKILDSDLGKPDEVATFTGQALVRDGDKIKVSWTTDLKGKGEDIGYPELIVQVSTGEGKVLFTGIQKLIVSNKRKSTNVAS